MNQWREYLLILILMVGIVVIVLEVNPLRSSPLSSTEPTHPTAASTTKVTVPETMTLTSEASSHANHDHDHPEPDPVAEWVTTTLRYPPPEAEAAMGEEAPVGVEEPGTTVASTSPVASSSTVPDPGQADNCRPGSGTWRGDGHPVEDRCTLAEVRRALYLAYTGTDQERRTVIRNSHLLDEVFAALDEFGRTHDAALWDPDRRGEFSVIYEAIGWRGGSEPDQQVIAVLFRLHHPDYPPTEPILDTLVRVDGAWKLSYRRSYCVKVLAIMEYIGSEVRCPRDPQPHINEDESPGSTGRY